MTHIATLAAGLLLLAAPFARSPATRPPPRHAVVLTTDVGAEMDDQWTLAQLAVAPEIDLRGIVTTHSPTLPSADSAAAVARDVLAHLPAGHAAPVVLAGSSVPLGGRTEPRPNPGVTFIVDEARRHAEEQVRAPRPRRLVVLVTGAATDVASALLLAPDIASKIDIVAMAFDDRARGGDSWNVRNDVAAWQVLLASPVAITIGDAAVTKRELRVSRDRARRLFGAPGVDRGAGRYLVAQLERWLDRDPAFCYEITGERDTWVIWDQVVVAHLLGLTRVEPRPRPVLRDDLSFVRAASAVPGAAGRVAWVVGIDEQALWRHFVRSLRPGGR